MSDLCGVVADLLPLYIDNACTQESRELVASHLQTCERCAEAYGRMQSDVYEPVLQKEKTDVVARHMRATKRRTFTAGAVIAGILCIPIAVCLIVNLVTGHALDWFFIVLFSLCVFASLTVVPLMCDREKGLWTLASFTGSLILLLFVCMLFGDARRWFAVAAPAVLFGLWTLFSPYVAARLCKRGFWAKNKGLFCMATDTALLAVLLVCIGWYARQDSYWRHMPPVTLYTVGFAWLCFVILRYVKANGWIRAALFSAVTGAFLFSVDTVVNRILGFAEPWPALRLAWNADTADGNIKWMMLLCGAALGVLLTLIGLWRGHARQPSQSAAR